MNWKAYFKGIKDVCPWSWEAYQDDKILITSFDGVIPLGKYKAIVYTFDQDMDVDYLDILAEYLNHEIASSSFFFAHPLPPPFFPPPPHTAFVLPPSRQALSSFLPLMSEGN